MALSQKTINKISELYEQYHNKAQVARELGISPSTANRYLQILGITTEKRKKNEITEEVIEQINSLYKEYRNMAEVSRRLGIAVQTVKKYLTEENLELSKGVNEDREALWYYVYKLFGCEPVSSWNATQMEKFRRQGINYKAQLLTLKYFFEVKRSPIEKANGSIGIVPWVFEESKLYWLQELEKRKQFEEGIKRQLEQDRITIKYDPTEHWGKKKKKKEIDLSTLEES